MKLIDEVKEITANEIAKKQDAAKLNFPKIIKEIKAQAALGSSSCIIPIYDMNEYDKKLLEQEGFFVYMEEKEKTGFEKYDYVKQQPIRVWKITW